MNITPRLFEAYLNCPTQCRLRSANEPAAGNAYADWVQTHNESYRTDAAKRLMADSPADECAVSPATEKLKTGKWRLATDVLVRTPELHSPILRDSRGHEAHAEVSGGNCEGRTDQGLVPSPASSQDAQPEWIGESCIHAIERIPSEGRGKAAQFIPIRFIWRNKLTKDDKLLLAFDAFVLSAALGRAIGLGKIIHGDDHATRRVKPSAFPIAARSCFL